MKKQTGDRLSGLVRFAPWALIAPLFVAPLAAALIAAFSAGGGTGGNAFEVLGSASIQASLRFSLLQAGASTVFSLLLGLPGAWLLARHDFRGRRLFAALAGIPFVFPPVLFTLGFVRAWGRNGFVNTALMGLFGLSSPPIDIAYSFWGVVAAHTMFNFPLVIGIVSAVWRRTGGSQEDAARCLGAGEFRVFTTITLPALLPGIASAASLVFLYCFMSFAIPLSLGGGPEFATLEVSVYAAVSGNQDFTRAGLIALLEACCAVGALALYTIFISRSTRNIEIEGRERMPLRSLRLPAHMASLLYLGAAGLVAMSPALALLATSFTRIEHWGSLPVFSLATYATLVRDPANLIAMLNSALLGVAVAVVACAIALLLLAGEKRSSGNGIRGVFFALPIALSSVILSLGYLVLFPLGAGVGVLILVQATAAYPLAWRTLSAARNRIPQRLDEAAAMLGAGRGRILLTIDLPLLRPALMSAFALCTAISLGEINAALMLNIADFPLLGLRAYRLMGAYQYPLACALGVLVCIIAGIAFAASDRLAGKD